MFEAIRATSTEESTVARMALTAAELGYKGLLIRHPDPQNASIDVDAIASMSGIEIVIGGEITTDAPSQASGLIGSLRPIVPVLVVSGGTRAMNNFVVRQDRVDVLIDPIGGKQAIDHVVVKTAKSHGVHLEVNLGPVLRSAGGNRVRAIRRLRELWTLIDHYDAPFVVTGCPRSHLEFRAGRDLAAVGDTIDIDPEKVHEGMTQWSRIVRENQDRLAEDYVQPGVYRGKYMDES